MSGDVVGGLVEIRAISPDSVPCGEALSRWEGCDGECYGLKVAGFGKRRTEAHNWEPERYRATSRVGPGALRNQRRYDNIVSELRSRVGHTKVDLDQALVLGDIEETDLRNVHRHLYHGDDRWGSDRDGYCRRLGDVFTNQLLACPRCINLAAVGYSFRCY